IDCGSVPRGAAADYETFDVFLVHQAIRSCFEMVHEKIYEDVLSDFYILMKAHRGSYVTEEGWKKRQNRT
ncbi:MAG: hypothetical protein IKR30_03645, partial [Bacteroidales bacterium]|nr:hypothetical protein [Bacteroidales bacterium]